MKCLRVLCLLALASLGFPPSPEATAKEEAARRDDRGLATTRLGRAALMLDAKSRTRRDQVACVERGLAWLAANQTPAGDWIDGRHAAWLDWRPLPGGIPTPASGDALFRVGVTGLAVLAFQAAGHTHTSESPHASLIARALAWLGAQQDSEGVIADRKRNRWPYNHWIATAALAEAYALTGDRALEPQIRRAARFLGRMRNPYFAFRYGVTPGDNGTAESGFAMLAIQALYWANARAESEGRAAPFPVDTGAIEGMQAWLAKVTDPDFGRVGNMNRGRGPWRPKALEDRFPAEKSECLTAVAHWFRSWAGPDWRKDLVARRQLDLLTKLPPTWNEADGALDFVYWFFGAMAIQAGEEKHRKIWAEAMHAVALGQQVKTGSAEESLGSWEPKDVWSEVGGRVYATSMMCLMLCAPARHPHIGTPAKSLRNRIRSIAKILGDKETSPWRKTALLDALEDSATEDELPLLKVALGSKQERIRRRALNVAARLGPLARALSGDVRRLLKPTVEAPTRAAAARALGRIGKLRKRTREALQVALADPDPLVRVHAAMAIRTFAPEDPAAMAVLETEAEGASAVRPLARRALGRSADVPAWTWPAKQPWLLQIDDETTLRTTRGASPDRSSKHIHRCTLGFRVEAVPLSTPTTTRLRLSLDRFRFVTVTRQDPGGQEKRISISMIGNPGETPTPIILTGKTPATGPRSLAKALLGPWFECHLDAKGRVTATHLARDVVKALPNGTQAERALGSLLRIVIHQADLGSRIGALLSSHPAIATGPDAGTGRHDEFRILGLRLHGSGTSQVTEETLDQAARAVHRQVVPYKVDLRGFGAAVRQILRAGFEAEFGPDVAKQMLGQLRFNASKAESSKGTSTAVYNRKTGRLESARRGEGVSVDVTGRFEAPQLDQAPTTLQFRVGGRFDAKLTPYAARVQETFGSGGGDGGKDK